MHWPREHTGVSVGEGLVEARPLHSILDRRDRLLHIELRTPESGLLSLEIVKLLLDLDLQLEFLTEMRHFHVNAQVFQALQRLVDGIGAWVLVQELEYLRIGEQDGKVRRVGRGEVDRGSIDGLVSSHCPDYLLSSVAVIDEWCHYLCGVVQIVSADKEGVITEGGWVIWEEWESGVVVCGLVGDPMVVDGFFDFLYMCDLFGESKELVLCHFPYHVGQWNHHRQRGGGYLLNHRSGTRRQGDTGSAFFIGENGISVCRTFAYTVRRITVVGGHSCEECMSVGRGGWGLSVLRGPLLCLLRCSFCIWILVIEVSDKFWGVFQVLHGFPGAVTRGESLPLN